jgi:hypothetical protein
MLASSKRLSISSAVADSFHWGLSAATIPVIERADSNFGLMSEGNAEMPLSFASIPSMNFYDISP